MEERLLTPEKRRSGGLTMVKEGAELKGCLSSIETTISLFSVI